MRQRGVALWTRVGYGAVAVLVILLTLFLGLFCNPPTEEQEVVNAAWREFAEEVAALGDVVQAPPFNRDERTTAEGYRHVARMLSTFLADSTDFSDPGYPQFMRFPNAVARIGWDNPDNLYLSFRVRGDHSYLLRGNVRNFDLVTIVVYNGIIGEMPAWKLRPVSMIASPDLAVNEDGAFELVLSADPALANNWLALTPDASVVIVRRIVSDWNRTDPGLWEVVNLTTLGQGTARPSTAAIMEGLQSAVEQTRSLRTLLTIGHRLVFQLRFSPNEMSEPVASDTDFPMAEPFQAVSRGYFKLEKDEALVIEAPVADCLYSNIQLANPWMESMDYASRQTSLNHATTHIDADGRVRYVVSQPDPGVQNWLDTAGYSEGSLFARWAYCDEYPVGITSQVVRVAQVRDLLPQDTPRVGLSERRKAIEDRQRAVSRRYAGGGGGTP